MGNFLVSSVCRAHGRSGRRRCAAQQAALLRALSSKMALTAAVMSCWVTAATNRARAALVASLVFIAKKFIARTSTQRSLPSQVYDDVFNEFNAVFETAPQPTKTLRELHVQHSAKLDAESLKAEAEAQQGGVTHRETPEYSDNNAADDEASCYTDGTNQLNDFDDEYELLPKPEEDRAFYADLEGNQVESDASQTDSVTEGERLLQLASSISDTSMRVEEFIINGKHDNFEVITKDVDDHAAEANESEKRSIVRVLLAYCAYSEDSNYSSDMVLTAEECLQVWQGDEDRAFKSLAVLCNDVPRLCAALE
ncbi:hypothetical protein GN958_ATG08557 [Phytophthora infestans]|uniref:Uncharacterized protein n=1 Tax=Phytophthora infestans TaxID=4787 RepID=A0A8S9UNI9_PHYIN|nr:hypothetical protein GN958_ATG08557 [Phytophthora infestans]